MQYIFIEHLGPIIRLMEIIPCEELLNIHKQLLKLLIVVGMNTLTYFKVIHS